MTFIKDNFFSYYFTCTKDNLAWIFFIFFFFSLFPPSLSLPRVANSESGTLGLQVVFREKAMRLEAIGSV